MNRSARDLELILAMAVTISTGTNAGTVAVKWNNVKQEIVGIGASVAAGRLYAYPSLYDLLFKNDVGIGLSIMRISVPSDMTAQALGRPMEQLLALYAGGGTGEGLINTANGNYTTTKRLWAMGNWSKFVRPGWKMIRATHLSPDGAIGVSAFKNETSGKFAIVAVNFGSASPCNLVITLDGFRATTVTPWLTDQTHDLQAQSAIAVTAGLFSATLSSFSLTTFVGIGIASASVVGNRQLSMHPGLANGREANSAGFRARAFGIDGRLISHLSGHSNASASSHIVLIVDENGDIQTKEVLVGKNELR